MVEGFWFFHCPECGFGNEELGYLAADHELLCEVCLEENRGPVRLQRCEPDETVAAYARLRRDLAA
jgi:hypothetical protein